MTLKWDEDKKSNIPVYSTHVISRIIHDPKRKLERERQERALIDQSLSGYSNESIQHETKQDSAVIMITAPRGKRTHWKQGALSAQAHYSGPA